MYDVLPQTYFHPLMNPDEYALIGPFSNYPAALALRRMTFGAPASPCGCPCPQPSVGWLYCIYSLHVTTNSHCVRYRHYTHTLTQTRMHTQTHLRRACRTYCAVVTIATFFCLMGLVYQMPSTIMCTYQSYHDDKHRPRVTDCLSVCISPGINLKWT